MMQENLDFDAPLEKQERFYCVRCDQPLYDRNWALGNRKIQYKICKFCDREKRKEFRKNHVKANTDPNKVWDTEYIKKCCYCKKKKNAELNFNKEYVQKDGYSSYCNDCKQSPKLKMKSLKAGAKKRGYEWDLELKDTSGLILSDCYYCGKPSQEGIKVHGLDRVKNDRGYHLDNVVPCCYDCNIAKHANTQEDFIEMCKRVAERHSTYEKSNVEWTKVYLEDSGVGEIIKENFIDPIW